MHGELKIGNLSSHTDCRRIVYGRLFPFPAPSAFLAPKSERFVTAPMEDKVLNYRAMGQMTNPCSYMHKTAAKLVSLP